MVIRNLVYYRPVLCIEMSKKASTPFVWCVIQVSSSSGGWGWHSAPSLPVNVVEEW